MSLNLGKDLTNPQTEAIKMDSWILGAYYSVITFNDQSKNDYSFILFIFILVMKQLPGIVSLPIIIVNLDIFIPN